MIRRSSADLFRIYLPFVISVEPGIHIQSETMLASYAAIYIMLCQGLI